MASDLDFTALRADDLLALFNDSLANNSFDDVSEETLVEGICFLQERIKGEVDDQEREKLFYLLTKIGQITQMDYLWDLYE